MGSPMDRPDDDWWSQKINRRESIWLGIAGVWSVLIFGWMSAYTRIGDQNPIGETFEVSAEEFSGKFEEYQAAAEERDDGALIPDGDDVFILARQWDWQGTPVVLEAGREYDFHLSSVDVQHGFSVRPESALSKHMNLQILPDYEWVLPMEFDEPGEYHVICNEFCGAPGHRTMHGRLEVVEEL